MGLTKQKIRKYTDIVNRLAQKLSGQKIYALLASDCYRILQPR